MLYVFDKKSGQFKMMIYPYFIEYLGKDSCVLYVQDACGNFFSLTFPDRSRLVAVMEQLRATGVADARCDISLVNSNELAEREIQQTEGRDDIEREDVGREIG